VRRTGPPALERVERLMRAFEDDDASTASGNQHKATRDLDALGLGGADEILFLAFGKQQIVGERGGALVIGQGAQSI
jgi:hypothetical protein